MGRPPHHEDYHPNIIPGQPRHYSPDRSDFCVPDEHELNFAVSPTQLYASPGQTERQKFDLMCLAGARILRLVRPNPDGTPDPSAFLIFSAAFAAQNPELWDAFQKVDLGSVVNKDKNKHWQPQPRIKILSGLYDDLIDAANSHGKELSEQSGPRAAAIWMADQLHDYLNPNSPKNAECAEFFERFIGGRNRREADGAPLLRDVQKRFEESWLKDYGQDGPISEEDLAFLWDSILEDYDREFWKWQFERAKLLRWPGLPPRCTTFKYWSLFDLDEPEPPSLGSVKPDLFPQTRKPSERSRQRKPFFHVPTEGGNPVLIRPGKNGTIKDKDAEIIAVYEGVHSILEKIELGRTAGNLGKKVPLRRASTFITSREISEPDWRPAPNVLPDEARQALQAPYEATLFELALNEKSRPSEKSLHGLKIIRRVGLDRKQKQVVAGAFRRVVVDWDYWCGLCYGPLYALQIFLGAHTYDFLLDLDGHQLVIVKDDHLLADLGATGSCEDFARLCRAANVSL